MYMLESRIDKIVQDLGSLILTDRRAITEIKKRNDDQKELESFDAGKWEPFLPDERWGGKDTHYWFMMPVEIPADFSGKPVVFEVKTGREGQWDATNPQFLIYVDGKLIQGLDVNHTEIILCENAEAGKVYQITLHAYSGMEGGLMELKPAISILDRKVESLYYNLKVPLDIIKELDKDSKNYLDILRYLNEAVNLLDLRKPGSLEFHTSVIESNRYLENEFYGKYCGESDITALCVGHTHIDVAWLWRLRQTREKAARSFSTVLNLMKQYPEYKFMSSQPQLYKFIKEDYPELYSEIKERVKEGRWEPEGAMWLEADCNLSSGEALVRQVLFGTRFFYNEFGVKNKILWLPDVFGYSAALPQILKKSGIDYFVTSKISWNEYNKLPYDTFMWRGLDGTEILTYFLTTSSRYDNWLHEHFTTYNGNMTPSQTMGAWQRYQQKDLHNEVLISYGYGDGGGGPTKGMLEMALRQSKGIPGCPKVVFGTPRDFFKKLEESISGNKKLPKWVGELYLEYHRGTYTSMARNKKFNRKSEFTYQNAEAFSMMNTLCTGAAYPQEQLNKGWETILLNQFHDILPGSSIKGVYEDSKEQYMEVLEQGTKQIESAMEGISGNIGLKDVSAVVFNPTGFIRTDIVKVPLPEGFHGIEIVDGLHGKKLPCQIIDQGKAVLFLAENVPSKGYKAFTLVNSNTANAKQAGNGRSVAGKTVSNPFFDVTFNEDLSISSIYDRKNDREVVKAGQKANVFQAFEDKPLRFDAWDINLYYQEKMWEVNGVESAGILEEGPVRTVVRIRRKFLDSIIEQDMILYNDIPRIDFATRIDWKEKQILLKAAFPVDVHADKASYEIQYGNVERPTHWNTSWDYARFEVCAHKWADLSEDDYGVSLLNDCKYGYDIKDGVMRLTLLKSAVYPNEDADRELHEFTYSLYPHAGDWKQSGTVREAYSLNCPMPVKVEAAHEGSLPGTFSLVNTDCENVMVEVVKKAEDSEDVIIRLYEYYNRRSRTTVTFGKELSGVRECDLMENDISEVDFCGNSFSFEIKPYEIKTFKLRVKKI